MPGGSLAAVGSRLRPIAGMGLPVSNEVAPERPIRVNDELVLDNGTPFPGALRRPPRSSPRSSWQPSSVPRCPNAAKVYPYDNLTVDLGGRS